MANVDENEAEKFRAWGETFRNQGKWKEAAGAYKGAFHLEAGLGRDGWAAYCLHTAANCLYEFARLQGDGTVAIAIDYRRDYGSRDFKIIPKVVMAPGVEPVLERCVQLYQKALIYRQNEDTPSNHALLWSATHHWMLAESHMHMCRNFFDAMKHYEEADRLYSKSGNKELARKASDEWIFLHEILHDIGKDSDHNTSVKGTVSFDRTIRPPLW